MLLTHKPQKTVQQMSNYIEIIVSGTTHFVHVESAAGQVFDMSKPGAHTRLVAISDFIIDQDGKMVKCRYPMEDLVRAYCRAIPNA